MSIAAFPLLLKLVQLPIQENVGAVHGTGAKNWLTSAEHALGDGAASVVLSAAHAAAFCDRWLFDGPARLLGTLIRYAAMQRRIARLQRGVK